MLVWRRPRGDLISANISKRCPEDGAGLFSCVQQADEEQWPQLRHKEFHLNMGKNFVMLRIAEP